ncbi:MAG: ribosomal L7Ae/L30e/S12e/Gadd45 family protein [Clostridia bacterium]|nr:ribosomal L7Ae/L30e/S12e/Gadd45 family protein [Clostridia bacterium]MBQ4625589.1 ribosomal L7Ae/L30e/S12e/Gadd45 family protein [Clostridia bacterium]
MKSINKSLTTLGLARRAGKLTYGETSCREAISREHVALVILASDAGESVKRTFTRLCEAKSIPIYTMQETKSVLGAAIGKEICSVVTVNNKGFADSILASAEHHIGGGHI